MTLPAAPSVPVELIEWRVDGRPNTSRTPPSSRFVPYIGAATVAGLLDEWVGPDGWSDAYEVGVVDKKEAMWCTVSIRVEDRWVSKTDIGVPTNFEGQKGAVSDAFKRAACLKWGVGRNVYQLPTLWAPCKVTSKNGNDTAWPTDQTIPHLLTELERLGYGNVEVTRLQAVEDQEAGGEAGPPEATASPAPPASTPLVSVATAESMLSKAKEAGLTDDEIAAAVKVATGGRTGVVFEVSKSEVPRLRRALFDDSADPGRAFEPAGETTP